MTAPSPQQPTPEQDPAPEPGHKRKGPNRTHALVAVAMGAATGGLARAAHLPTWLGLLLALAVIIATATPLHRRRQGTPAPQDESRQPPEGE